MPDKSAPLANAVDTLSVRADEVLHLAKGQRAVADKQHVNAHKLEVIGEALKGDVAILKDKLNGPAGK